MFSPVAFAMTINEVECPECKSMAQRQIIAYDPVTKEYLCECENCENVFSLKREEIKDESSDHILR